MNTPQIRSIFHRAGEYLNKKAASPKAATFKKGSTMGLAQETIDQTEMLFNDTKLKKARELVENKIAKGQKGFPYIEILTITPEIASIILQRNPADENRKLSVATVNKYAADMANGLWKGLNGQTIVISNDGYLNDGQHRLNAVIQSGGSIPFTVVFGADRESRLTLDQNKVRTSGDYLTMVGVKNANSVAAVANILMAYESGNVSMAASNRGSFKTGRKPSKAEIHAYATSHIQEIEDGFNLIGDYHAHPCPPSRSVSAFLLIVRAGNDYDEVAEFIRACLTGENITRTSPAYQARERMISEKLAGTCPPMRTLEIILRCWNAHKEGRRMNRLALRGELPTIGV